MSDLSGTASLAELVREIKDATANLSAGDQRVAKRFEAIEANINQLLLKSGRPGGFVTADDEVSERKSAIEMCHMRYENRLPKQDGSGAEYIPTSSEIDEALVARRAYKKVLRHGRTDRLEPLEQKSLSSFSFGTNGFILPPERSNEVLNCLIQPTDVSGLVNRVQISSASISFLITPPRMGYAAWSCESNCWANNPAGDLQLPFGELNIKAEELRYVACVSKTLLEDSAFDIEGYLFRAVSDAFRDTLNMSIIAGDGVGKPLGVLSPQAGIPVCQVSPATAPGTFTWQDLLMLKYEVPISLHEGSAYYMNQRTLALLQSMSSAEGRPLFGPFGTSAAGPGLSFGGSPIIINSWLPDVEAGTIPIMFGNLRRAYTLVERRGVIMEPDPYTAAWCMLYKFSARFGGSTTCPNALRLLRIS